MPSVSRSRAPDTCEWGREIDLDQDLDPASRAPDTHPGPGPGQRQRKRMWTEPCSLGAEGVPFTHKLTTETR